MEDQTIIYGAIKYSEPSYLPTSAADFQNAIDVLHRYMHYVSYMDYNSHLEELQERGLNGNDMVDERPNQQLWQRLKNDIVQDREQVEGASFAKICALAQNWAHYMGAKTYTSPRCRFRLLIDEEAMETLLKHPMPARSDFCRIRRRRRRRRRFRQRRKQRRTPRSETRRWVSRPALQS